MKNKKAVRLLATINIIAMMTMLGQPVVKAEEPKENYVVEINESNFPDELLRNYMTLVVDDNRNGKLESDEIKQIKQLCLGEYDGGGELEKFMTFGDDGTIGDLKGIEYLTDLEKITVSLSTEIKNKQSLYKLTKLKNITLIGAFKETKLKTLDFSNFKKLKKIQCVELSELKTINLSKNSELASFECYGSHKLKNVDASKCRKLKTLKLVRTDASKIILGKNRNLKKIIIKYNKKIKKLNISKTGKVNYLKITEAPKLKKIVTAKKQKIKNVIIRKCKNISKKDIKKIKK